MNCAVFSKFIISSCARNSVGRKSATAFIANRSISSCCLSGTCSNHKNITQKLATATTFGVNFSSKPDDISADDPNITALLNNNKKWVADRLKQDPQFFEKIGRPQQPKYLYFGCSDSRVPANEILGLG